MAEFERELTAKLLSGEARVKIDMDPLVYLLEPAKSPLFQIFSKITTEKATSYKHEWMEDQYGSIWDAVNNGAGYSATDTSIVVDDATKFIKDDVVVVPRTSERMLVVSSTIATNTLVVVRGYSGLSAGMPSGNAALVDDDPLMVIGQAKQEGWTPDAMKRKPLDTLYNYVQFFSEFIQTTETAENVGLYGGSDRTRLLKQKLVELKRDIENAILFGARALDTSSAAATSNYQRSTFGGLTYFIGSNIFTPTDGIVTETWMDDVVLPAIFMYGNDTKWLFSGSKLLAFFDAIAKARWAPPTVKDAYGVTVRSYFTSEGTLNVVKHPLLISSYAGYAFIIDPKNLSLPFMTRTTLRGNVQEKSAHTIEDEYFAELTMKIKGEKTHGIIKGVTGYSIA